jgi:hypothetical protein
MDSDMFLDAGQNCDVDGVSFAHVVSCAPDWLALGWEMRIPQWLGLNLGKHNFTLTIVSKQYQNHIKTTKTIEKLTKSMSVVFYVSFFGANPPEPYQNHINHIKIVSKSYQNRIKTISKSCFSHKNPREIEQKPVPGLFLFPFLKPTHGEP